MNISRTLSKNNIFHNDFKLDHFLVHNEKITLIDFGLMSKTKHPLKMNNFQNIIMKLCSFES